MAAINIVRKMAMVKKCGRSSQRTARVSQRSWSGACGDGTLKRARLANVLDEEGDQPASTPGVALIGWVHTLQHPLIVIRPGQLGNHENGQDERMRAEQGGRHQPKAGDD